MANDSRVSQSELARRIRNASPIDREGRYDMASKVECKAYVAEEVARIEYDMARVPALEARIAELELSIWAKFKRWFKATFDWRSMSFPVEKTPPIGTVIKKGDTFKVDLAPHTDLIKAAIEKAASL